MAHKGDIDVQLGLAKITSGLLGANDQPWFSELVLAPGAQREQEMNASSAS